MTSNLGSDVLQDPQYTDKDGVVTSEGRDLVMSRATSFFAPGPSSHHPKPPHTDISLELVNRLDSIQTFNKLSHTSILSIVSLRLADVTKRLADRRITLDVDTPAREWLAEHGYSAEYGARAIARVVQNSVLFPLAKKLLSGTIR